MNAASDAGSRGLAEAPGEVDDSTPLFKLLPAAARPKFLKAAPGQQIFRRKYSGLRRILKAERSAWNVESLFDRQARGNCDRERESCQV